MRITQITVGASMTVAHPTVRFSNVKPDITITATLDTNDSVEDSYFALRDTLNKLISDQIGGLANILQEAVPNG